MWPGVTLGRARAEVLPADEAAVAVGEGRHVTGSANDPVWASFERVHVKVLVPKPPSCQQSGVTCVVGGRVGLERGVLGQVRAAAGGGGGGTGDTGLDRSADHVADLLHDRRAAWRARPGASPGTLERCRGDAVVVGPQPVLDVVHHERHEAAAVLLGLRDVALDLGERRALLDRVGRRDLRRGRCGGIVSEA